MALSCYLCCVMFSTYLGLLGFPGFVNGVVWATGLRQLIVTGPNFLRFHPGAQTDQLSE